MLKSISTYLLAPTVTKVVKTILHDILHTKNRFSNGALLASIFMSKIDENIFNLINRKAQ